MSTVCIGPLCVYTILYNTWSRVTRTRVEAPDGPGRPTAVPLEKQRACLDGRGDLRLRVVVRVLHDEGRVELQNVVRTPRDAGRASLFSMEYRFYGKE